MLLNSLQFKTGVHLLKVELTQLPSPVLLKGVQKPAIQFVIAKNNPWTNAVLMLHTRFDLPDAFEMNGLTILPFLDEIQQAHKVACRKKITKKPSTRKAPCVKHEFGTCQSIEDNK